MYILHIGKPRCKLILGLLLRAELLTDEVRLFVSQCYSVAKGFVAREFYEWPDRLAVWGHGSVIDCAPSRGTRSFTGNRNDFLDFWHLRDSGLFDAFTGVVVSSTDRLCVFDPGSGARRADACTSLLFRGHWRLFDHGRRHFHPWHHRCGRSAYARIAYAGHDGDGVWRFTSVCGWFISSGSHRAVGQRRATSGVHGLSLNAALGKEIPTYIGSHPRYRADTCRRASGAFCGGPRFAGEAASLPARVERRSHLSTRAAACAYSGCYSKCTRHCRATKRGLSAA